MQQAAATQERSRSNTGAQPAAPVTPRAQGGNNTAAHARPSPKVSDEEAGSANATRGKQGHVLPPQNNSNSTGVPGAQKSAPAGAQLRVLTYNMFLRPPPVSNNGDDYKNERQKLLMRVIDNFDIVCFQEVFGFLNTRKHKLIYGSLKRGFYYHAEAPNPSFFSSCLVDGGLLTLSKFPIVYEEYRPFGYGVLSDTLSQKGVLYTKIQVLDTYLHLFNTHLQASYVGEESKVKATVITRVDQLQVIRKFVDEMLDVNKYEPEHFVLLAGDFNVDALGPHHNTSFIQQFQSLIEKLSLQKSERFAEYDVLHNVLSNFDTDKLVDLMRESYGGQSQITYGDVKYLEDGTEMPAEVALTLKDDQMTKQSLDYMLEFQPAYACGDSESVGASFHAYSHDGPDAGKQPPLHAHVIRMKPGKLVHVPKSTCVEKMFVTPDIIKGLENDPKIKNITQLSDHYGVSCALQYLNVQGSSKENQRVLLSKEYIPVKMERGSNDVV